MKVSGLKKHGDILLFIIALTVLVTALFRVTRSLPVGGTDTVPPHLVFTQWWTEDGDSSPEKNRLRALLQAFIEEFESLHKGIKITLNFKPYEDLRTELFASVTPSASSEAVFHGDVLALDPLWVPELQKKGVVEGAKDDLLSFINVLYYNINILKEAGFSRPPKTRPEFIDYAKAIAGKEANYRVLAVDERSSRWVYDDVYPWVWAAGARLIQDGKPALTSRPVVETLSFLASLKNGGFIVSGGADMPSPGGKLEAFCSGRAAFMIAPAKDIAPVRKRMGDAAFGVSSVPAPDNFAGKSFYGTSGWTIGVNAASAHREEAALFTDFLAEKASALSKNTGAVTVNDAAPTDDPFSSKVWDITIAGEGAGEFSGLPWTELETAFGEELSSLFAGTRSPGGEVSPAGNSAETNSPAETAAAIQKRWETVLEGL